MMLDGKPSVWYSDESRLGNAHGLPNEMRALLRAAHMLQYGVRIGDIELTIPER